MFTYLRVAAHIGGDHTAAVSLDNYKVTKKFNAATVRAKGKDFSRPHLAGRLYPAYRKQQFPSSPNTGNDAIQS